ncbi:PrsW family glutamic-type intramembrane protease [Pirellulaceae bacterium SH449]
MSGVAPEPNHPPQKNSAGSVPQPSPYQTQLSPLADKPSTANPRDHSIEAEPWFSKSDFLGSPNDQHIPHEEAGHFSVHPGALSEQELAEHSVWDEPTVSGLSHSGPDERAVTWFRYYLKQVSQTSVATTWLVTAACVFLSGPAAIFGAFFGSAGGQLLVMVVLFGPTVEEILKIGLALWIVEKRPWLFAYRVQIYLCGVGGGLLFAAIENWIYLNVYIPQASPGLVVWRWTVCVALHTVCSTIAAYGLIRMRHGMLFRQSPPRISDGGLWIATAITLHAIYNLSAYLGESFLF